MAECATQNDLCPSSIAKVADLDFKLESLFENEDDDLISSWRGRVIEMIERIDSFERQYLHVEQSPKIASKAELSLTTPTPICEGTGDHLTGSKSVSRINS